MIILKIMGGLGNQMSQMAFALALSKKTNDKIYIDASVYKHYKIRHFSINNLSVHNIVFDYNDLKITKIRRGYIKTCQILYHIAQKIIKKYKFELGSDYYNKLVHKGHYYSFDSTYYGIPISSKRYKDIYGYFLAEKYYRPYKEYIREQFKVSIDITQSEKKILDMINTSNAVAISMRLQDDYLRDNKLNVCTEKYFQKGIQYIKEKITNPTFFVFADDIERAKKIQLDCEPIYIEGFCDYQSMRLLYSCKHYIISNSSFSWWGAYLGEDCEKIIVAPSRWMNSVLEYKDKYYDGMVLIDC